MSSYIVTASTSVVLVDTSILGPAQSAIVLLSSQMPPGRNVTVRDSLGYLSSPQSIIVSTTRNISFMDGTSSIFISQPFASMTFSSRDANTWNIVNTFGFPLYNTIANVSTLAVSTLIGNSLTIGGTISTATVITNSISLKSTSQVLGPMFVSTLVVGTQPSVSIPYETNPGYSAYIIGSANVTSNVAIGGALSVGAGATFGSSITVAGNLTANGGASIYQNFTVQGNLTTQGGGSIECQSMNVQSSLTVLGPAIFNSNVSVLSNLQVGASTITNTLQTSSIQINSGGYIQLGNVTIITGTSNTLSVNTPIFTPFLSTQSIQASATATTTNLEVLNAISGSTVNNVLLGSAVIQNSAGSLITSSIQTNTLQLSNNFSLNTLTASTLVTSNITASGSLNALSPGSFVSTGILNTSTLNVSQLSTGSIVAGIIQTPSIQVSSLFISRTFTGGPALSSINILNSVIENSQGSLYTGAVFTSSLTTSSLALQSGNIFSPNPITFNTPAVSLQNLIASTLTASTFSVSTLNTSRITIGSAPPPGSNGPDLSYISGQNNVLITGGPGDYLSPYYLSNVKPAGQDPALPYTTSVFFNPNFYSQGLPPGLVIGYTASLYWGNVTNSYLTLANGLGPTLYSVYGSDQSISGTLPLSSFSIQAVLYGNSAINVSFGFQYSPNINSITSNTRIEFNNGSLNWNYALNGTTIQNSLNDMSIRNIFYYGSLNFASDPRIKKDVKPADLKRCYETISRIPLRTYKYIDEYCSTFKVSPSERLGFLATDLLPEFPKSVHVSDTLFPEFSTDLMTIDTSQIDMAHLGTTKYLIETVRKMEEELSTLRAR